MEDEIILEEENVEDEIALEEENVEDEITLEEENSEDEIMLEEETSLENMDYNYSIHKPQINNVELVGNNSLDNLGIVNDKNYIHYQNTASNLWIINHNLNKYPAVNVVDSAGNEVVGDVEYIDVNNLKITFTGAFKGRANLN